MRARNLKPGFFSNELLGKADPLIGILFQGLWCSADREGRLEDRPLRLCGQIFPYRRSVTEKRVHTWLQWLHDEGFITRYSVDKSSYIQINEFLKHQTPHSKERLSEIPALIPREHKSEPGQGTDQNSGSTQSRQLLARSDSGFLNPDSLNPDSHITPSPGLRAPEPGTSDPESEAPERPPPPAPPDPTDAEEHAQFERLQATYPPFGGRQNWITTEQICRQLVERGEATWDQLFEGTTRFAAFVAAGGRSGPHRTENPVRFYGDADRPWAQPWDPPPPSSDNSAPLDRAEIERRKSRDAEWNLLREEASRAGFRDPIGTETRDQFRAALKAYRQRRESAAATDLGIANLLKAAP